MAYDSLVLQACVNELHKELANAKINKIHQPDERTLLFRYHGQEGNGRLLICAHPENGRLHKTVDNPENPAKAPLFVMVLRKYLEGSRIVRLQAAKDERIATITFASRNEMGDNIELRLIVEIMGKHSNIILVDGSGIILDGIRRYGSYLSRYREVLPGKPYIAPPPIDKLPFLPESEEELAAHLYQSEADIATALMQKVKGISPLLAKNIPLSAGISPKDSVESLGSYEISRIYQQLQDISRKIEQCDFTPTLLVQNGHFSDYYLFDLPLWQDSKREYADTVNAAVDAFFIAKVQRQTFEKRKNALAKALRQNRNRLQKKIAIEESDLANCEAADKYRDAADLLAANLYYLQKGQSAVELPSFEDPQTLINITLDPAKSPQENIKYYYKRYTKAKNSRKLIEEQLTTNRAELDYLLSIEQTREDSQEIANLDIIEKEASQAGFYKYKSEDQKKKKPNEATFQLPPREYISLDGFSILIGRNNKQNDHLSLKMAQADDIWLHAQKIPGSHVIIRSDGKTVPDSTLLEAAGYAAWFSKARQSGKTAIDYTKVSNIWKPNGAVPGYVAYREQETIYTEPKKPDDQ